MADPSNYSDLAETELVRLTLDGSSEAFSEMVSRHQARLRAFAARYVGSSDDVYDLVQDSFITAFDRLDRFDNTRDFGKWLRGICRNRILKYYRETSNRSKRLQCLVDAVEHRLMGAENEVDDMAMERIQAIRACIDELDEPRKDLIAMRYFHEMPVNEMAKTLGKNATGISVNLMRIRAKLRKAYELKMAKGTL